MLAKELEPRLERLVQKAWKPPTFTQEELLMPLSFDRYDTLVSLTDYLAEKIDVQDPTKLNEDQERGLVVARLSTLPDRYCVGMVGIGNLSKSDLIKAVQGKTAIGQEIVRSEIFNVAVVHKLIAKFRSKTPDYAR